ncbi:hypothetical protein IJT17_05835 [bacterium]|nr:hypothetical protein [bacterium]
MFVVIGFFYATCADAVLGHLMSFSIFSGSYLLPVRIIVKMILKSVLLSTIADRELTITEFIAIKDRLAEICRKVTGWAVILIRGSPSDPL